MEGETLGVAPMEAEERHSDNGEGGRCKKTVWKGRNVRVPNLSGAKFK